MNQKTQNILFFLGFAILAFLVWYFSNIVVYILIAAVVSMINQPIVRAFEKIPLGRKQTLGRGASAMFTLLLIWVGFFAFFSFMIPLLGAEASELGKIDMRSVLDYIDKAFSNFSNTFPDFHLPGQHEQSLLDYSKDQLVRFLDLSSITDVFGSVAGLIGNFFMMFFSVSFILFFFLKEENMFINGVLIFVPAEYEKKVEHAMDSIFDLLKRYFQGLIIEVIGIMVIDTVGFTIIGLGFNHAIVVALFAGLMNVIPYIGPWIGGVFGVLVAVATNINEPFMTATLPLVLLVLLVVAISQFIDNVIFQPLIYSNSVKAHPLEIFLVILMAGSFAGILGMVLAIPAYTVLRVIAKEFFSKFKIVQALTNSIS